MKLFKIKPLLIVIIFSVIFVLYVHHKGLINPYFIYGDICSLYFIHGFADETALANDLYIQAVRDPQVFRSSIPLVKPLLPATIFLVNTFSLPLALTLKSIFYQIITVLVVFKIGKALIDDRAALILAIFFLIYSSTMDSFFGGAIRGLGFLVTCIIYYCLIKGFILATILLIPLTFILYPPILPMVVMASFFAVFSKTVQDKDSKYKFIITFVLTLLVILVINLYVNQRFIASMQSFMLWKEHMNRFPVNNDMVQFLFNYILNLPEHQKMYAYLTFGLIILNILFLFAKRYPYQLMQGEKKFILAAFLAFVVVFFIHRGIASRQLIFSLPLFLLIFFWKRLIIKFQKRKMIMVCIIAFLISIFVVFNKYAVELKDLNLYKNAFSYFSQLPKETLIAGHPSFSNFITFFTKRAVFFTALWQGAVFALPERYKKIFDERENELLEVLYTSKDTDVFNFIKKNKITHFFIMDHYYSKEYLTGDLNWPENEIRDKVINFINNKDDAKYKFVLLDMAHNYGYYFGNGIYILDCQEIIERYVGSR